MLQCIAADEETQKRGVCYIVSKGTSAFTLFWFRRNDSKKSNLIFLSVICSGLYNFKWRGKSDEFDWHR